MDYDQLFTFCTVVSLKNYSKAAEILNVTQPTVTARIKNLENELSCKLFVMSGRTMTITSEGKVLLEYAQKTLNYIDQLKEAIHHAQKPSIKIGFAPGFSHSIVLKTIHNFQKQSDVSIMILEGTDSLELLSKVQYGEFDIVFIRNPPYHQPNLIFEHIYDDRLMLITNYNHRLAGLDIIDESDLAGEMMICYRRENPLWIEIEEQLGRIKSLKKIEIGNNEMIKSMVKAGWGINIMSETGMDDKEKTEISVIRIEGLEKVPNKIYAVYKKESSNLEYIQLLTQSFKNVLSNQV